MEWTIAALYFNTKFKAESTATTSAVNIDVSELRDRVPEKEYNRHTLQELNSRVGI